MSAGAKHQIIRILDDLPEPSLAAVAEFVDFLRAKAIAAPAVSPSPKEPRPYGLCAGEFTTPDDFDAPLPDEFLDAFEGNQGPTQ
jgi:hypothetical protein